MTTKSSLFKLKSKDFWKGMVVAIITAAFTAGVNALESAENFTSLKWQPIALASLIAFGAYMTKNFFSNSEDKFLTPEPPK